jgi:hypothetical protein
MSYAVDEDVGTAPPSFDPECAAALAAVNELMPPGVTSDMVPLVREFMEASVPSDGVLLRGGAYQVEKRGVPGPAGPRRSHC